MSAPGDRLNELFAEALALEVGARGEWLAAIEGEDADLARELRSLLEAHERAEATGFLRPLDEAPAAELLAVGSPAPAPDVGDTLGRFHLREWLGGGAMGVVFLADDPTLDRHVAIKLLPPWIAVDDDARRRFLREARSASRLDHPNVATVHEVGETEDGRPWIVMAYCEGPTLAERLRAGPLAIDEARRVLAEMAAGLAAAHRLGIVHRDVKPGNVVLTATGARILDFGIAQIDGAAPTQAVAIGTLPYMSPEQTRGEEVDARTDVWSLGAVGYELLTGERPFAGANDTVRIHRIREDAPRPLSELRTDAPRDLVELIDGCLAKVPEARPASAVEVLEALESGRGGAAGRARKGARSPAPLAAPVSYWRRDLKRVAVVVIALGVAVAMAWPENGDGRSDAPAMFASVDARDRSVAVLPFESVGGTAEDAVWARGLHDDLLTGLAGLPALRITSRRAVEALGAAPDPATAARELGVRWVVEGSVRPLGDELRLNLRVVDPETEAQAWAGSWRAPLTADGLLELETGALRDLGAWLEVEAGPALEGVGAPSLEAWRLYVEGRTHLDGRTESGLQRAEAEFRAAVEVAPGFAAAWAGLADALVLQGVNGYGDPPRAFDEARVAAGRAIELQPDLPEAHATMGMIVSTVDRDGPGALWWLRRAVAMQPSNATAQQWLGAHLVSIGRLEEAGPPLRRAVELEPNSAAARSALARWHQFSGSPEDGLREVREAQRLEPGSPARALLEGELLRELGRTEVARETLLDAMALPGVNQIGFPGMWVELAATHLELGDSARAQVLIDEIRRDMPEMVLASVAVVLGEDERALDLLESGPAIPVFTHILRYHPVFDPIRGGPRMEAILQRYDSIWGVASTR